VQGAADGGRLAHAADSARVDVIDLDRAEAEPLEPRSQRRHSANDARAGAGRSLRAITESRGDPCEHDSSGTNRPDARSNEHGDWRYGLREAPRTRGLTQK